MKSMTGYGSGKAELDGREINVELKAVNHRFLDINIRAPRSMMFLEDELRKTIGEAIVRGHIEVGVTYRNTRTDAREVDVDSALALQYKKAINKLAELGFENNVKAADIMRISDILIVEQCDDDKEAILALMRDATRAACEALNKTRENEGIRLKTDLLAKLTFIEEYAQKIAALSAGNLEDYAQKLKKRIDAVLGDDVVDQQRLAQEIAIYADKIAIDEELVRLKAHIENMRAYMQMNEALGRKLDFFIQELNREINTIGSKSVNAEIAAVVVSAKGEIEKLREQIQNIE